MKLFVFTSLLLLNSVVVASPQTVPRLDDNPEGGDAPHALLSNNQTQEKGDSLERPAAPTLPPATPFPEPSNPRREQPFVSDGVPNNTDYANPATFGATNGNSTSPSNSFNEKTEITIQYMKKVPVHYQVQNNGAVQTHTKFIQEMANVMISLDSDLEKIDLDGDGKRAAIQAITAHRHGKLLQALKDAKSETEKEEAAKKLQENYRAHYASETKWRTDRIAELEKRMEEMRSQVKERAAAEEKFLEAAMTLAKLNAQGIAAEPPQLKASNPSYQGEFSPQPYYPSNTGYSTGAYAEPAQPNAAYSAQPNTAKPQLQQFGTASPPSANSAQPLSNRFSPAR
jgi:hypothetical protein